MGQVAGAAAAAGRSLEEVQDAAHGAMRNLGSVGVAATVGTLPGSSPSDRYASMSVLNLCMCIVGVFYSVMGILAINHYVLQSAPGACGFVHCLKALQSADSSVHCGMHERS